MSAESFRQEMPPPGGYTKYVYTRNPAKVLFSGWQIFGGYIAITCGGLFIYYQTYKRVKATKLEMRCQNLAIYPLLLAENDREYLKQLRRNRDEERDLMKNVEGWKVGTWYGEPLYRLKKEDDPLFQPIMQEYYVHANFKDMARRALLDEWF